MPLLLKKRLSLKWVLLISPIVIILVWFLLFKFQIVDTYVDFFYSLAGTSFWIVFEFLGIGYLGLSRFSFFKKNKPLIIFLLILGYLNTWVFGVPAGKKMFLKVVEKKSGENIEDMNKDMDSSWYRFHAIPIFPWVLLSHEEYKYGLNRRSDVDALYFWYGFKTKRVPVNEPEDILGDKVKEY